jgi:hypothetical protein
LTLDEQDITDKRHLFFKIKFFKMPAYDLDPASLDLFYLQIKTAVLGGDYLVPETVAVLLATFQVQISVGNYVGPNQLATTLTCVLVFSLRDCLFDILILTAFLLAILGRKLSEITCQESICVPQRWSNGSADSDGFTDTYTV